MSKKKNDYIELGASIADQADQADQADLTDSVESFKEENYIDGINQSPIIKDTVSLIDNTTISVESDEVENISDSKADELDKQYIEERKKLLEEEQAELTQIVNDHIDKMSIPLIMEEPVQPVKNPTPDYAYKTKVQFL